MKTRGSGNRRRRRHHQQNNQQNRKWKLFNENNNNNFTRISHLHKNHPIGKKRTSSLIKQQSRTFRSFTNSTISPSTSEIDQQHNGINISSLEQQKKIDSSALFFRPSHDLCSSPKNTLTNSLDNTIHNNQLSFNKKSRPSVIRLSQNETSSFNY